jgi:hypothetical protein
VRLPVKRGRVLHKLEETTTRESGWLFFKGSRSRYQETGGWEQGTLSALLPEQTCVDELGAGSKPAIADRSYREKFHKLKRKTGLKYATRPKKENRNLAFD